MALEKFGAGSGAGWRQGRSEIHGGSIAVEGLRELQQALKRADSRLGPDLKRGLARIATVVRREAVGNITNRTGRHGSEGRLEGGLRISMTQRSVSVYSNLEHSRVQDQGGQVGRHRATLLKRSDVSQYMTKAVRDSSQEVEKQVDELLDQLGRNFEGN